MQYVAPEAGEVNGHSLCCLRLASPRQAVWLNAAMWRAAQAGIATASR
jgi:hypothetical protein